MIRCHWRDARPEVRVQRVRAIGVGRVARARTAPMPLGRDDGLSQTTAMPWGRSLDEHEPQRPHLVLRAGLGEEVNL